ncbi:MAG: hypothetical protein JW384_00885 [Nitrosomonadaceae bacterium]|nr:hypothetical protein [Nitrosomonadaceae bacterium]
MLKNACARSLTMRSLSNLRELLGVAEQYQVTRRGARRQCVSKRELPRLVNDQYIYRLSHHLRICEEPGSPSEDIELFPLRYVVIRYVSDLFGFGLLVWNPRNYL